MKYCNSNAANMHPVGFFVGAPNWLRRATLPIVFAIPMAICLATAPQSHATLINYTLSDTIGVVDQNRGNLAYNVTAAGSFTFDTSNNNLLNVSVTLTNAFDNGATNILTNGVNDFSSSTYFTFGTALNPGLFIGVANSLAGDASESLIQSSVYVNTYATGTSADVGSVSVAAVPEPGSFVLLGGMLALFGVTRRMGRPA
jgi:hypothetical protein